MHFALEGRARANAKSFSQEVSFTANQHNIIYAGGFKGALEWSGASDMRVFEVNLTPAFFEKYLPEGGLFDLFRQSINKKESGTLTPQNYPITPQMNNLIRQIIHCNRVGQFKRMFLESQVMELLMLQLEQMSGKASQGTSSPGRRHEEKLFAVKEILKEQLNGEFSLNALAQKVGTNEFTLKKGFKELFGMSVFSYWTQLKMEEARVLLAEGLMNVDEVSGRVGYKNPQHFSTAFKRYYGYSPRELRASA